MNIESTSGDGSVENSLERKARFMKWMQTRHDNALRAFKIEDILSHEKPSGELREEAYEALQSILDNLSRSGLTWKIEHAREAIDKYFIEKIIAQQFEIKLQEKLKGEGKEFTSVEIGLELFQQRTGASPKKSVEGVRQEGYYILTFSSDGDYLKFVAGSGQDESTGIFHQATRFPNMTVDVVLNRYESKSRTIPYTRQHFIDSLMLDDLIKIESGNVLSNQADGDVDKQKESVTKGLGGVKDELLARIRDGSDSLHASDFFGSNFYKYLSNKFSADEQKEINILLKKIELELRSVFHLLRGPRARGILVYHLIDIPLSQFPEQIKAVVEFYNTKINEFKKFIPNQCPEEKRGDSIRLWWDIENKVTYAADLIVGIKDIDYKELPAELEKTMGEIKQLKENYDNLLA